MSSQFCIAFCALFTTSINFSAILIFICYLQSNQMHKILKFKLKTKIMEKLYRNTNKIDNEPCFPDQVIDLTQPMEPLRTFSHNRPATIRLKSH